MAEGQDISSLLQGIGLTEYEGRVYVALISLGKARAKEISEITSIAYPKVYDVLASLKQKGFVEEELGRPKIYRPVNPSRAIRNYVEERVSLLKSKAEQLIDVLATKFRKSDSGKSEALVIQSKRGVLDKLKDLMLRARKEILISVPNFDVLGIKALLLDLNVAKRKGINVKILTSSLTLRAEVERALEVADVRVKEGLEGYYVITDAGSLLVSSKIDDLRAIFVADDLSVKPMREHFNYVWFEATPASLYLKLRSSERGVIVLAGGASKRMGRDKTLLQVKGIPMIKRVVDAALKVSGEVIVVTGNKKMSKQISKIVGGDVVIVEDEERGWGPLMGILTGCKRAYAEYVVVVPCDAPFLNPKILMELFKRAEGHDAAIPRWPNGYLEPLHSVYRRQAVLDVAQELMKKGSRSIIRLIESLRDVVYVSVEELKLIDEKLLTFFNVNTPRDLLMAETMESP
jgi:molybdopterin-guanine dinucleotide biosynthesis protein A